MSVRARVCARDRADMRPILHGLIVMSVSGVLLHVCLQWAFRIVYLLISEANLWQIKISVLRLRFTQKKICMYVNKIEYNFRIIKFAGNKRRHCGVFCFDSLCLIFNPKVVSVSKQMKIGK